MAKITGVLFLTGIVFWLFAWETLAAAVLVAAGIVLAVLLILVAIELHQDKVLNEIAMRENKERERNGEIW